MPVLLNQRSAAVDAEAHKRRIAQIKSASTAVCARARGQIQLGKCRDWNALGTLLSIEVPAMYSTLPFTKEHYDQYLDWYVATCVARAETAIQEAAALAQSKLENVSKHDVKFEKVKLRPQQKKALDQIIAAYEQGCSAVMVAMGTGRGKTIVFGAFLEWLKRRGELTNSNIIFSQGLVCTKKPVVLATREKIQKFFDILTTGDTQENFGAEVGVYHYSTFAAKKHQSKWKRDYKTGQPIYDELEVYGNVVKYPRSALVEPLKVAVFDECHELKKPTAGRTKRMLGIIRSMAAKKCFYIFASATPAVTLNDTRLFNLAAGLATEENMATFLGTFTEDPRKPDNKGMRKYNEFLGIHLVRPPEDRLSYKIFNRVDLVDFPNESVRAKYFRAEEDYIHAVEASGGIAGDTSMSQFTIYRATAEELMAPIYADYMCAERAKGRAPVLAVCFVQTVLSVCSILAQRGWTREELSIIMGGQKVVEAAECYTAKEMADILQRAETESKKYAAEFDGDADPDPYAFLTRKEKAKFTRTREFNRQRLRRGETKSEQNERVGWLKNFDLSKQNDVQRHEEVTRFLADITVGCIFTFAAGGTGLDLDNQIEGGRPRTLISTICYWAEEFLQAFGRCARIMTKSDVYHIIIMFKGTMPVQHVLPRLEPKLRSIKTLTGIDGDLEDILAAEIVKNKGKNTGAHTTSESVAAEQEDFIVDDAPEDDEDDED